MQTQTEILPRLPEESEEPQKNVPNVNELFGMFNDGRLSSDDFIKEKAIECRRCTLKDDRLEKALKETWKNKEKFYEDTKGLSMLEIVKGIENKYKGRDATLTHKSSLRPERFSVRA
ncbi:hypothetical protein R80B4_03180 [Fibrobacteres bacterium R8-0-B4]